MATTARTSVERTLEPLRPLLTEGRTAAEAAWALDAYQQWVLPPQLDVTVSDDADAQRWEQRVADELGRTLAGAKPADRWPVILRAAYTTRVATLSHGAFELASTLARSGRYELARGHAEALLGELRSLDEELADTDPDLRDELALELSEAQLDCRFVITGGDRRATSLRLGAYLSDS